MGWVVCGVAFVFCVVSVLMNAGEDDFKRQEREFHMKALDRKNPKGKL